MKLKHAFLVLSLLVLGVIVAACTDNTPEYALNVTVVGNGTVTSDTGDIDCSEDGDDCSDDFDENTSVTLTAAPAEGATFTGFSGDCTGTTCTLEMDAAKNVTATFTGGDDDDDDETGGPETGGPETGGPETGGPETGGPETGGPETGGPETGGPETGGPETGGPETGGTEATTTVAAGSDDAEEFLETMGGVTDGQTDTANTDLEMVTDGDRGGTVVGVRFADVAIPANATITDAYIQFTADGEDNAAPGSANASFIIEVQDNVNAPTFVAGDANNPNSDITGRTYTGVVETGTNTGPIVWAPSPWTADAAGVEQRAPVTGLVQTIVSRAGWTETGDIVFKISDNPDSTDTGVRTAVSYDGNQDNAAQLVVTYTSESEED